MISSGDFLCYRPSSELTRGVRAQQEARTEDERRGEEATHSPSLTVEVRKATVMSHEHTFVYSLGVQSMGTLDPTQPAKSLIELPQNLPAYYKSKSRLLPQIVGLSI